jgi:hypothetical protein
MATLQRDGYDPLLSPAAVISTPMPPHQRIIMRTPSPTPNEQDALDGKKIKMEDLINKENWSRVSLLNLFSKYLRDCFCRTLRARHRLHHSVSISRHLPEAAYQGLAAAAQWMHEYTSRLNTAVKFVRLSQLQHPGRLGDTCRHSHCSLLPSSAYGYRTLHVVDH